MIYARFKTEEEFIDDYGADWREDPRIKPYWPNHKKDGVMGVYFQLEKLGDSVIVPGFSHKWSTSKDICVLYRQGYRFRTREEMEVAYGPSWKDALPSSWDEGMDELLGKNVRPVFYERIRKGRRITEQMKTMVPELAGTEYGENSYFYDPEMFVSFELTEETQWKNLINEPPEPGSLLWVADKDSRKIQLVIYTGEDLLLINTGIPALGNNTLYQLCNQPRL